MLDCHAIPEVRMPPSAFSALLFDMDGLMIDTESLSARAWQRAAEALAIPLQDQHLRAMVGLSTEYCLDYLQQALPAADIAQLGVTARALYHRTLREDSIPLKPGIIELLQWCEQQAIPRAVATATQRALADIKLARSQLAPFFCHSVCGDEVARSKPAPDVYLKAAALLGMAAADCIVLEDSPHGARAALAAGMRVILVPDLVAADADIAKQALAVCQDLFEAQSLLAGLLSHPH